ncbi:MAG TPA: hydroxymethylbilane synthase [Verrucomicrobiae bacterium]|nr:hydroxymethylbilane synthase [Verrucomicrobiae bacterium]
MTAENPIHYLATRGSALAMTQARMALDQCAAAFPYLGFDLKIVKTTGDKLQTASLAQEGKALPKGLFTKELELALLEEKATFAVHSLKDLPTELPEGLELGAALKREDARDVLIYRDSSHAARKGRGFGPELAIDQLPSAAVVATSSTRRKAQALERNPGLTVTEIRGNVLTRLQKLARQPEIDATILALAGMVRLGFSISPEGKLEGEEVPEGLLACVLDLDAMLPCVGQGAIGLEIRQTDERASEICERLNHYNTMQSVLAERAFLAQMGGGCQSPVAAFAQVIGKEIRIQALSFQMGPVRRAEASGPVSEPLELGRRVARELSAS